MPEPPVPVAAFVDVHYLDDGTARAAAVLLEYPCLTEVVDERVTIVEYVADYAPGEFYRRELPAVRAVLDGVVGLSLLVVDGYVDLDPSGRPGLGFHAARTFGLPVIGIAKTRFASATHAVPALRGKATRPLFVTSDGLPIEEAAALVAGLPREARLPWVVKRVDRLARGLDATDPKRLL